MFKKIHIFRIKPGQELLTGIDEYCQAHRISSGVVLGMIGSLNNASLAYIKELPGKYETFDYKGPLEIVAAQGSIALKDSSTVLHIHIHISSPNGCYGGHLNTASVFSTAEVVIGELDFQLKRSMDSYTGLNEITD